MIEITDEDINQLEIELGLSFDLPRREALKGFTDVQACPGSGKTTMVATKLLLIAKKWTNSYQGVCVLTHTNVAKNEILSRLKKHQDGYKLLAFPHFIGTIQEFFNKYLGIPFLRSEDILVSHIDDDLCCSMGDKWLRHGTRSYLQRNHVSSLQDLQFRFIDNELKLTVPGFDRESPSPSYKNITDIKGWLINKGYHFYREMYEFSELVITDNPDLIQSICKRFPVVFVDEMQDTQKFQDELINKIFDNQNVFYQRFGDPDQAIYGDMQNGNETYNNQDLEKVVTSHRFTPSIAAIAKNLSLNQIELSSELEEDQEHTNTIFLVDDNSRQAVFSSFANICSELIPEECNLPIKAVGAVGKHKENSLTICDYYPGYEKSKSDLKFRPDKLIHYFYKAKELSKENNVDSYALLQEAIIRCGQMADIDITHLNGDKDKFSKRSLKKFFREANKIEEFNSHLFSLLTNNISEELWGQKVLQIINLIGLDGANQSISDFIAFSDFIPQVEQQPTNNDIVIKVGDRSIKIEVTTVHSVKGETHAATLVLENKFHNYDAELIIDYILGEQVAVPTALRKIKFMKQFYVGFTRPRHLICLVMDKSRFPDEHQDKTEIGHWKIEDLTSQVEVA